MASVIRTNHPSVLTRRREVPARLGTGSPSIILPPGLDRSRVVNVGCRTAASVHIYGTDIARYGFDIPHIFALGTESRQRGEMILEH